MEHEITYILIFLMLTSTILVLSVELDGNSQHKRLIELKKRNIVSEHNKYRKLHSAINLTVNKDMSEYAQQWVDHSMMNSFLESRPHKKYGENLWEGSMVYLEDLMTSDDTNPVKAWHDQIKNYPGWYENKSVGSWKYFTQLVWRKTRRIGVGIASMGSLTFVACYYDLSGNERLNDPYSVTFGRFKENVLPPQGKSWPSTIDPLCYFLLAVVLMISLGTWLLYRK